MGRAAAALAVLRFRERRVVARFIARSSRRRGDPAAARRNPAGARFRRRALLDGPRRALRGLGGVAALGRLARAPRRVSTVLAPPGGGPGERAEVGKAWIDAFECAPEASEGVLDEVIRECRGQGLSRIDDD